MAVKGAKAHTVEQGFFVHELRTVGEVSLTGGGNTGPIEAAFGLIGRSMEEQLNENSNVQSSYEFEFNGAKFGFDVKGNVSIKNESEPEW